MSCSTFFWVLASLLASWLIAPSTLRAATDRVNVAYTGIYLMGDQEAESHFPIYSRNKEKLSEALRVTMKQVDSQGALPFTLMFDSNIEDIKLSIDNTLSLAFLVVRDDVATESFNAAGTSINKSIVNVGLVAILYDTRKIEGKDRNVIVFSFPLVGYAQRLDGERLISKQEVDALFVESAVKTVRENLIKRLAGVAADHILGEVADVSNGKASISIGALKGVEEGQNVSFLVDGKKTAAGRIVRLDKETATVALPKGFAARPGMKVEATNMRAISEETYQVINVKVSSTKAAGYFPPAEIGPQVAQWFSNFLTARGGKVVQPSRIGGAWDQRATETAFTILDRAGKEFEFELPTPKYPILLDITGVASKVTDSNEVNDICLFKAWIKLSIPSKKYEKTFDIVSSKSLIKGVQSFEEKNELYDLLYQLTAKIAREADI